MLHYLVQTIVFQLFFLIIYDLFLKQETFFNWNRMYLLVTAALSVTLPFIKLNSLKNGYISRLYRKYTTDCKRIFKCVRSRYSYRHC